MSTSNLLSSTKLALTVLGLGCLGLVGCLRAEGPPPFTENGESCESSSQCHTGSVCEYDSLAYEYVCRVSGGCTSHTECPSDQACAFGSCVAAECSQDSACGAYACDTSVRLCFDSCKDDFECGDAYVCRDGECLSGTCTPQTAARVCFGTACLSGVCANGFNCAYDGCAENYYCDGYSCVRPCSSDVECDRYTCDTSYSECRESCFDGTECRPGYVCKDFFCQLQAP